MAKIKNLMFDLGGVLLNIDYNKTSEAFKNLGVSHFDELYSQTTANHLFEDLETGKITEEDFYKAMQVHCHAGTTTQQIAAAWNAMLLNFRISSLEHLKNLKEKYTIYLLSNTNSIHLTAFNAILKSETGDANLDDYFTTAYYSHKILRRKPYPATYQFVLSDAGLIAEETMFIDDSIANVEGASQAGLQAYHLLSGDKIEEVIL